MHGQIVDKRVHCGYIYFISFENEPDFVFFNPDFIDYRNKDIKNVPIVPILIEGNKRCSFV